MVGRNDKGKGKKVARKTKKSISRAWVPVSMMNAPPLVIREPDNNDCNVSKRSRTGRNPSSSTQQNEDSESGSTSQSDGSTDSDDDMVDVEDEMHEMESGNVIGSGTASDPSFCNVERGYDLTRQRNPNDLPKTISIFQNITILTDFNCVIFILRPNDVPRWFCPEIRCRFNEFWKTFEATNPNFRNNMWESFRQWYIVPLMRQSTSSSLCTWQVPTGTLLHV
ncbi:hypothetical protein LIER_40360 [Lithospermum erythrorhizon]|uniref:Uncharacterized protein n=1 Tax=Lithospermum erythrorhizon TaxID=34254 RepID=A0AAV3QZ33_LITER